MPAPTGVIIAPTLPKDKALPKAFCKPLPPNLLAASGNNNSAPTKGSTVASTKVFPSSKLLLLQSFLQILNQQEMIPQF